ncbi:putative serine/threonine-protein kinase-like protein [Dinothrombium tinctorium]|uniref:Putative serine/threonine-protein kinase-like protein n=1 Tax=Dinothrombium tinctorium TaxID=1965070 RepID=A0A3S3QVJ7_9ACAR|nr:putative serine/threonine-protein kinase-like protein [Dinothrombium tinctorium]
MEYAGSQSLQHLLDDSSQTMNASLITNICSQISSAIKFCHNNSVVHLDLKPSNIIISPNFICKLVDFGCSQKLSDDNNHIVTVCDLGFGTPAYTAPEIFEGLFPTEKCDIYSFGIMMWQLVTRQSPYANMAIDTIIYRVRLSFI